MSKKPATKATGTRPDTGRRNTKVASTLQKVSELDMVAEALLFMRGEKKGRRVFPSDAEVVDHVKKTYQVDTSKAVIVLRHAHRQVAEVVQAIIPTLAQTTISDLREIQQEARRVGDLGTAGRVGIAIGRFMGLDGPQANPEQQAKQLSDAALEAAMQASLHRLLETMPADQFADLQRRRDERAVAGAKPAMIEATGTETHD